VITFAAQSSQPMQAHLMLELRLAIGRQAFDELFVAILFISINFFQNGLKIEAQRVGRARREEPHRPILTCYVKIAKQVLS
jgi:hypothetical protein